MVVLIALITLSSFVVYFIYLQYRIWHHTQNKREKLHVILLISIYLFSNAYFYYNIDIVYPFDLVLIISYIVILSFFWGFHLLYRYIFKGTKPLSGGELDMVFRNENGTLFEFLRKFFHFFSFYCIILLI